MNLDELLDNEENKLIDEAKHTSCLEYERHWHEMSKEEAEKYNKKHGTHIHGYWTYPHRENAGAVYNDGTVVHHKDRNKHNNDKNNLMKISRSEHCIIDPNALKHEGEKCKKCGDKYYAKGLCYNCYMKEYRKKLKKIK